MMGIVPAVSFYLTSLEPLKEATAPEFVAETAIYQWAEDRLTAEEAAFIVAVMFGLSTYTTLLVAFYYDK